MVEACASQAASAGSERMVKRTCMPTYSAALSPCMARLLTCSAAVTPAVLRQNDAELAATAWIVSPVLATS
jgi:hypothetical protein